MEDVESEASICQKATSNSQLNNQNEIQPPVLVAMQQFVKSCWVSKRIRSKSLRPVAELVINDPVQGVTPSINVDNLSAVGRRPINTSEELMVFMTKFEIESVLKKEKEKASVSSICLDLKHQYALDVAKKS